MSAQVKDALKMAAVAIDTLAIIGGMAPIGSPIAKMVEAIQEGLAGKTTPEIVEREIASLRASVAADRATGDKIVHDRFDKSEGS